MNYIHHSAENYSFVQPRISFYSYSQLILKNLGIDDMNKSIQKNSKIEATTGEVYFDYPLYSECKTDTRLRRLGSWVSDLTDAHFDRLVALRVYDQKRVDL